MMVRACSTLRKANPTYEHHHTTMHFHVMQQITLFGILCDPQL